MLIRLWRKSAAYWLAYRNNPFAYTLRYEDLVQNSDAVLDELSRWLDIQNFPDGLINQPLCDHAGKMWKGNSSFGDKIGIEHTTKEAWRTLLTPEEIRFIEACTKPELTLLGYTYNNDLQREDISNFSENVSGVRESYLATYCLDPDNRKIELERWETAALGEYKNMGDEGLFLIPDIYATNGGVAPKLT